MYKVEQTEILVLNLYIITIVIFKTFTEIQLLMFTFMNYSLFW